MHYVLVRSRYFTNI